MKCLHKFEPHPELQMLFCVRCGEVKEIASATEGEARQPSPRRSRSPRRSKQDAAAAAAEAELARLVMELPLGEAPSSDLEQIIENYNRAREEQNVPVVDDDRIGAGTGL